jgi:hypothetical protein
MPDPAPSGPPPGDGVPTVTVTPQPVVTAGGDDNAALLADLEAEMSGKAPTAPAPAAKNGKPAPAAPAAPAGDDDEAPADPEPTGDEPAAEDDEEPAEEPEPEDEDPEDEEPADDSDDDPAIAAEADKDPALKARLDAVRRTEERQRQRLTTERQSLERDQQQFVSERGQALQRIQQFDQLAARAKYDLPSVVRALGIEPSEFEYHAQSLMAHSPKFADKAEYRQTAERAMREREAADQAATNARKLADLESKLETKERQAAAERELDTYFSRAMRKATEATPITATLIKSSPKAARAALLVTAHELTEKLGRLPKSAELLTAHEKKETRLLALRGIKPTAKAAPAPAATKPATAPVAKPNGQPAPAKPGKAPTAAAPVVPAATPADPLRIPTRDELLQELQSGTAN